MKNIKRGLSIAIVAAMVLGMTACGGSGKTESAGKAAEKKSFSLKLRGVTGGYQCQGICG